MHSSLQPTLVFLIGFTIGVYFAFLDIFRIVPSTNVKLDPVTVRSPSFKLDKAYESWLDDQGLTRFFVPADELSFNKSLEVMLESEYLQKKISIACAVISSRSSSTFSVSNTWVKKCSYVEFFGSKQVPILNMYLANDTETWNFLCRAIRFMWRRYKSKMHWLLISPDTAFIIPENLRYLLAPLNHKKGHYLGHNLAFMGQLYNSIDAGIVLSKGAVKALIKKFPSGKACEKSGKYRRNEDYLLGKFLTDLGIRVTETRDELGRDRFHRFTPLQLIVEGNKEVLEKYSKKSLYPPVQGVNCCSPTSVSFQSTNSDLAYFLSYLLNHVKVYQTGHLGLLNSTVASKKLDEVWQKFIMQEYPHVNLESVDSQKYYDLWTLKETPEKFNERLRKIALANISLND